MVHKLDYKLPYFKYVATSTVLDPNSYLQKLIF